MFSDEEVLLEGAADPDARYDRLIRPWKSRLGLLYLRHRSLWIDLRIIALTVLAIVAKRPALHGVDHILAEWGAAEDLRSVCRRKDPCRGPSRPAFRRDHPVLPPRRGCARGGCARLAARVRVQDLAAGA